MRGGSLGANDSRKNAGAAPGLCRDVQSRRRHASSYTRGGTCGTRPVPNDDRRGDSGRGSSPRRNRHCRHWVCANFHFGGLVLRHGSSPRRILLPGSHPSLANNIDADLAKWGCTLVRSPDQVPERPGVFERFRHMHRMPFERTPGQVTVHPGLGRLVFPHQLLSAVPDAASEGWAVTWRQTFGPFALEAKRHDATITVPAFGSPVAFIMEAGPQGGEVAIRLGQEENRFPLLRDKPELVSILCSGQNPGGQPVQLRVLQPPAVCSGIRLEEVSFTLSAAKSFDFDVLRPLVAT